MLVGLCEELKVDIHACILICVDGPAPGTYTNAPCLAKQKWSVQTIILPPLHVADQLSIWTLLQDVQLPVEQI